MKARIRTAGLLGLGVLAILTFLMCPNVWTQERQGGGGGGGAILNGQAGNGMGLTNLTPYTTWIQQQPFSQPLIHIGSFGDANSFFDTRWATNYINQQFCYNSEIWVSNQMQLLRMTGAQAAGFNIITLGDGQYAQTRDANGYLQPSAFYPHGFQWLNAYARSNGFYLSSYIALGNTTCCGCPGSGGNGTGPDTIYKDVWYNYTNGFYGLYIDACGNAFLNNTNNVAPLLRQVIREANDAAQNAWSYSTNGNAERHPFYIAGPTATGNSGGLFSYYSPDMSIGSVTLGWIPNEASLPPVYGIMSNITGVAMTMKGYSRLATNSNILGPGRASFGGLVFSAGNPDQPNAGFGGNEDTMRAAMMAMTPMEVEIGHTSGMLVGQGFQNVLLLSLVTNQALLPGKLVFSNNLQEVFSRQLGGPTGVYGGSNLLWIANENPVSTQTITVSNNSLGIPLNQSMIAYDVFGHQQLTNYYNQLNVTLAASNAALIYLYPWDTANVSYSNPPSPFAYPPNAKVDWMSNSAPLMPGSSWTPGSIFRLRNNGNATAWSSTNSLEIAPPPGFDPSTNANCVLALDVQRSGFLPGDVIDHIFDFSSNHWGTTREGQVACPFGTNSPNGHTSSWFWCSNSLQGPSGTVLLGTSGLGTNTGVTTAGTNLLVFITGQLFPDPLGGAGIYFNQDNGVGAGTQIYQDSGGLKIYNGSGSFPNLASPSTGWHVWEFFSTTSPGTGTIDGFIAMDGVIQVHAGGAMGTPNISGIRLGANAGGVQNGKMNIGSVLVFTNAATIVTNAIETNITKFLLNY